MASIVSQIEEQQIQYQIAKHNHSKQDIVIKQKLQKIFCHFCPIRTEIISKKYLYKFPDGKAIFFCNSQEKEIWMRLHKLNS